MGDTRFVADYSAIGRLLRSHGVKADLDRRAARVAAAATRGDLEYVVRDDSGPRRARAAVVTAGTRTERHERKHHDLARYINAAR